RTSGLSSFPHSAGKLAKAGLVKLKHWGRSVRVELNARSDGSAVPLAAGAEPSVEPMPSSSVAAQTMAGPAAPGHAGSGNLPVDIHEARPHEPPAEGVRKAGALLASATPARRPMYLRNVKQLHPIG